jgi:hypothetical protein
MNLVSLVKRVFLDRMGQERSCALSPLKTLLAGDSYLSEGLVEGSQGLFPEIKVVHGLSGVEVPGCFHSFVIVFMILFTTVGPSVFTILLLCFGLLGLDEHP